VNCGLDASKAPRFGGDSKLGSHWDEVIAADPAAVIGLGNESINLKPAVMSGARPSQAHKPRLHPSIGQRREYGVRSDLRRRGGGLKAEHQAQGLKLEA